MDRGLVRTYSLLSILPHLGHFAGMAGQTFRIRGNHSKMQAIKVWGRELATRNAVSSRIAVILALG